MLGANTLYLISKIEKLIKEEAFILFVSGDLLIEKENDEFVRIVVCGTTRIIIEPELANLGNPRGLTILHYDMEDYKVLYSGLDEKRITAIIKWEIKEILKEVRDEGINR